MRRAESAGMSGSASDQAGFIQKSLRHILAGGSAGNSVHNTIQWSFMLLFLGFVEVCCMQPIDVVKTRLVYNNIVGQNLSN